eukprot:7882145-Pyramimonas_sp.AAC.1
MIFATFLKPPTASSSGARLTCRGPGSRWRRLCENKTSGWKRACTGRPGAVVATPGACPGRKSPRTS